MICLITEDASHNLVDILQVKKNSQQDGQDYNPMKQDGSHMFLFIHNRIANVEQQGNNKKQPNIDFFQRCHSFFLNNIEKKNKLRNEVFYK